MNILVIGTAGRGEDRSRLNKFVYTKMVQETLKIIDQYIPDKKDRDLVSGGAAWADHVAVSLFLMNKANSLTLYLPDTFENIWNAVNGDAGIAHYYHQLFSAQLADDRFATLRGLERAIKAGASIKIGKGFKDRNLLAANVAEFVIAMTFNDDSIPKDGGTLHTWTHCNPSIPKHHINLFNLL